jgi:hypothetical protein
MIDARCKKSSNLRNTTRLLSISGAMMLEIIRIEKPFTKYQLENDHQVRIHWVQLASNKKFSTSGTSHNCFQRKVYYESRRDPKRTLYNFGERLLVLVEVDRVVKTQFKHWEGVLTQFIQYLRKWGEAGVVKL